MNTINQAYLFELNSYYNNILEPPSNQKSVENALNGFTSSCDNTAEQFYTDTTLQAIARLRLIKQILLGCSDLTNRVLQIYFSDIHIGSPEIKTLCRNDLGLAKLLIAKHGNSVVEQWAWKNQSKQVQTEVQAALIDVERYLEDAIAEYANVRRSLKE